MRLTIILPLSLAAAGLVGCDTPTAEEKSTTPPAATAPEAAPAKKAGGVPGGEPAPGTKGDYRTDPGYPKGGPKPEGAPEAAKPTPAPEAAKPTPAPEAAKPAPEAPKSASLTTEEAAEVAKLADPADRTLAAAQLMCPVSVEHLGSMGPPIKKVVDGKTAFLCCKGCEKEFDKDPKPYLAKLAAAKP